MSDAKTQLARDGTMQVTAKEGIDYLESAGHSRLLEMQGLKDSGTADSDKPGLARDNTMAATAKEGERFLEAAGSVEPDAFTRGQQKKIEEIQSEKPAESPKKPRLPKDGTMAATTKEAKELLGNEKLGDTRQETSRKAKGKTPPKRETTMAKTMMEAKTLYPDEDLDLGEGRRTRSKARGGDVKSPVKRAGTMQQTAKEGKDYIKRVKKAKKEEEEDKIEEEENGDDGEKVE